MAWNQGYNQGGQRGGNNQGQGQMPNSGALFARQKKNPNGPDMGGNITLGVELLAYIIDSARNGEVKIEVSAWRRQSRAGDNYLSLKAQVPWEVRQHDPGMQQTNPTYRPQQNWNRQNNGNADERAQYGPRSTNQQSPNAPLNNYAQASGRDGQRQQRQEDFAAGDRMPDFMRDNDPDKPPF